MNDLPMVARRAVEAVVFIDTCTEEPVWRAELHALGKDSESVKPTPCPAPNSNGKLVKFASGSGFFVDATHIATNAHVIERAKAAYVTSRSLGRGTWANIAAVTNHESTSDPDFAVLVVDFDHPPQPLPLSTTFARLQNVVAAGYPGVVNEYDAELGLKDGAVDEAPELTTVPGYIIQIRNENQDLPLILHSAPIGHGNSGGPLLDLCANVIGVNTLGWSGEQSDTGYKVNIAEGASSLSTFLKAHNVPFTTASAPCGPSPLPASAPGK